MTVMKLNPSMIQVSVHTTILYLMYNISPPYEGRNDLYLKQMNTKKPKNSTQNEKIIIKKEILYLKSMNTKKPMQLQK